MRSAKYWTAETIRKENTFDLADRLDGMAHSGETVQRAVALKEAARRLRLAYTFKVRKGGKENASDGLP